jgi:uncharacterized protein (DUF2267 family)
MESNVVGAFDATVRESNDWLQDVMRETGLDERRALIALRGVLHAVRDETTVRQSSYLVAQMPALIRGIYFEGWDAARAPVADHDARRFLERVRSALGEIGGEIDVARVARAVFHVLERRIPEAAARLKRMLPRELRELWPPNTALEVAERKVRLAAEEKLATRQALHEEAGHERGAPLAPHQNRTPSEQHRGGPLPNTM